jgi:hypothetical protein
MALKDENTPIAPSVEGTTRVIAARNNAFRLTASGKALRPVVESIYAWAESHLSKFNPDMADVI